MRQKPATKMVKLGGGGSCCFSSIIIHIVQFIVDDPIWVYIYIYPINSWLSTFFVGCPYGGFLSHGVTPSYHPLFLNWILQETPMWTTNYKVDNQLLIGYIYIYIYSYWIINYKLNYILITNQLLMNWIYTHIIISLDHQLRKTL